MPILSVYRNQSQILAQNSKFGNLRTSLGGKIGCDWKIFWMKISYQNIKKNIYLVQCCPPQTFAFLAEKTVRPLLCLHAFCSVEFALKIRRPIHLRTVHPYSLLRWQLFDPPLYSEHKSAINSFGQLKQLTIDSAPLLRYRKMLCVCLFSN